MQPEPAQGQPGGPAARRRPPLREVGEEPDYRFTLANERTFLAWIRTALALLAAGVAVVQLIPQFGIPYGRHVLGVALSVLSLIVALTSYARWEHSERAMRLNQPLPHSRLPQLLGWGLAVISVVAMALVLISAGQAGG